MAPTCGHAPGQQGSRGLQEKIGNAADAQPVSFSSPDSALCTPAAVAQSNNAHVKGVWLWCPGQG